MLKRLSALLYAAQNRPIDCEAIGKCYQLIKDHTGLFSSFRGNSSMSVATLLSMKQDPGKILSDSLIVYDKMKAAGFYASDYLTVASFQIASCTQAQNYELVISRASAFYRGMKSQHFFLTSESDQIFAAMLGLSNVNVEDGLRRMDEIYRTIKPAFSSGDGVQAVSQILVLGNQNLNITNRILDLNQQLHSRGIKMTGQYTLPFLGMLALLSVETHVLADEITEVCNVLRGENGFGMLSVSHQELILYAVALISIEYANKSQNDILTSAVSTGITEIVIAQQVAIIIAATTASAAASAAATSS